MVEYSLFTDKGNREINEDHIQFCEKDGQFCFVLCDGLGGHGRGEVASALVAKIICREFMQTDSIETFFSTVLQTAQNELLDEQKRQCATAEMKTTTVVLVVYKSHYRYAFIGDSRLYQFQKNKVKFRTLDHSVPQMLALAGDIREKQIRSHPDRNRLLRVMGVDWESPKYEVSEELELKTGDVFLLCSDGFWEPVTEKEMCRSLKKTSNMQDWINQMAEIAQKNSAGKDMDNFSAIAVCCRE